MLEAGVRHGLAPRLHADEFADSGGAELAAELGALSADHLMAVSPAGIEALAGSGVTAVLLPGTSFFLMKQRYAPARRADRGRRARGPRHGLQPRLLATPSPCPWWSCSPCSSWA